MTDRQVIVHKHTMADIGRVTGFELHADSKVIAVGAQQSVIQFWEEHLYVNQREKFMRHFILMPTGQPTPAGWYALQHCGTVLMSNASYVFHLYEVAKVSP